MINNSEHFQTHTHLPLILYAPIQIHDKTCIGSFDLVPIAYLTIRTCSVKKELNEFRKIPLRFIIP